MILYLCLAGLAGFAEGGAKQRVRDLQEKLPLLRDSARVDCLNQLAQVIQYAGYQSWDSAFFYARMAEKEALALDYKRGWCRSQIVQGNAYLAYQRPAEGKPFFLAAIRVARENNFPVLLNMARRRLGQAYWYQERFQEAIDEIHACIPGFEKTGNDYELINCYTSIASIYNDWGNYEKGFEYSRIALAMSREKKDIDNIIACYEMIGSLYAGIGDFEAAGEYYRLMESYMTPCDNCYQYRLLNATRGILYRKLGKYDSSLHYLLIAYRGNPTSTLTKLYIAETLLPMQRYDTALQILLALEDHQRQYGIGGRSAQLHMSIGSAYAGLKQYDKAILFLRSGILQSLQRGSRREFLPPACLLMASLYKIQGRTDSALRYTELYARMKDSVISDQLKGKMFEFRQVAEDEKKQTQIALLEKQKQISEQQLRIGQQNTRQSLMLQNILIGGILLTGLLSFIFVRNISLKRKNERLRNEQLQSQLQHKATDLEMQALRAQMNPHFIFNCLSSINRFILKNETEAASDYLTRFSRLIRLVLMHSRSSLILLSEELEMLKLYLDMEQLRFKNNFDYTIHFSNSIDPETIYIPPLLLQPFCENAIWHGLMHKTGRGRLDITLCATQQVLTCVIEDNGIGRARATEFSSRRGDKQKSLGLKITSERLALLNEENGVHTSYEIEDLADAQNEPAGTRVTLRIRYSQPVEELV